MIILWDIDGTLVELEVDPHLQYLAAVREGLGQLVELQSVPVHGYTEFQILESLLAQLNLRAEQRAVGLQMSIHALNQRALLAPPHTRAVRSANDALVNLAKYDVTHSVVTGNTFVRAFLKLNSAGLVDQIDFSLGAYGDEARDRSQLVGLALARARQRDGESEQTVLVVGDTPRDVVAAKAHGVRCVLVGSGAYTTEELRSAGADLVLDDLETGMQSLVSCLDL